MDNIIKLYKDNKEIINYLIIGVLTTVVSLVTYYLLTFSVLNPNNDLELQIANVISWIVSVAFAYVTNRKYVFESKSKDIKKELSKFVSSRITTLLIDMGLMFIFVSLLSFNDKIIKLIVQFVVIVLNYVFSKLFVFRKDNK